MVKGRGWVEHNTEAGWQGRLAGGTVGRAGGSGQDWMEGQWGGLEGGRGSGWKLPKGALL